MKKFELIVGLIAILGIFLQTRHWPGGGALTGLALMLLFVFYYVFSFAFFNDIRLQDIFKKTSYKDTNVKKIICAIVLGWALSTIIIGVLFKLQFWAGADFLLKTGLIYTGLILLIAIFFYFRNKSNNYIRVFKRIVIYGGLGLVLYLIPTTTFLDIKYSNNPNYSEHPDFTEHYEKILAEPYNSELHVQLEQLRRELERMKIEKWLQERDEENRESQ